MLKFLGIVKGIKTLNKQNKDGSKKWDEHWLGLSSPKHGGYDGEQTITDIRLTQKAVDNGMINEYTNLIDKRVEVAIYISARAWKDRAFVDYGLEGEGLPISVEGKPPALRKAS